MNKKQNWINGVFLLLASTASFGQTYGPVENFDVVNDTGSTAHGFEVELHDLHKSEISSIFGDASRWPGMERYGVPTVTEYNDPSATRTGISTRVTYRASYNGSWSVGTPSGTLPVSPSDSCWPYGAPNYGPNYPCDHFGVSTTTPAASVKYSWLIEETPGSANLVYQNSSVPAPVWTIVPQPPINNQPQPPQVHVVIAAPQPVNAAEFGEPRWVKVTATGTLQDVAVEDLMAENAVIQQANTQVQVEWQLLQTDIGNPLAGQVDLTGVQLDKGAAGIVYRFEFYQYKGDRDPGTGQALPKTSDTPVQPDPTDLGEFVVAQMAGVNFDGQAPVAPPIPAAPTINAAIVDAVINAPYNATITATPGNLGDVLKYAVTGLPNGLSVDVNTGVISGTPTTLGGPFSLVITVTDQTNGQSAVATTQISVVDGQITFSPADQTGTVGLPFTYNLSATGGTGSFSYSTLDLLPDGLALDNASGLISGTPTINGNTSAIFTATDSANYNVSAPINFTISAAPNVCSGTNLVITDGLNVRGHIFMLSDGQRVQYAQNTTTIVPPLTSADFYQNGNLVTFTGTNTNGICVVSQITVSQGLTLTPILPQTVGYGAAITPIPVTISGGVTPYTMSANGLPQGFSFDGSVISGSSTTPGSYPITIAVSDANGQTRMQTVTIDVSAPPAIVLGTANIPATGQVGVAYSGSVAATGGYSALKWTATGLPGGLQVSNLGIISGTPTAAGTFNPTFVVTDAAGQSAQVTGSIVISAVQASCTIPVNALKNAGKSKIKSISGNLLKTTSGVTLSVLACTTVSYNRPQKVFRIGDAIEWKGYVSGSLVNTIKITLN